MDNVARKYLIETFGCQMNVHDSERMAGLLEQAGFEATDDAADADVVVINTCSVRERAEEKLYTRLGELRQLAAEQGHDPIVAVAGCVAQQEGEALLRRSPGVADVIVGTQAIRRLPMLVDQAAADAPAARSTSTLYDDVAFPLGRHAASRSRQGLRDHHRRLQRVLQLLRGAVHPRARADASQGRHPGRGPRGRRQGRREVQLLGQIVNHYTAPDDPSCDFTGLLEAIHESRASIASGSPVRIRATSRIAFAPPQT